MAAATTQQHSTSVGGGGLPQQQQPLPSGATAPPGRVHHREQQGQGPLMFRSNSSALMAAAMIGAALAVFLTVGGKDLVTSTSESLFRTMMGKMAATGVTTAAHSVMDTLHQDMDSFTEKVKSHLPGGGGGFQFPGTDSGLSVIGTGFGPTSGSGSTRMALQNLGYGPTYHMGEVFARGTKEIDKWIRVALARNKTERQSILREILGPFKSTVDLPASLYWKDLAEMYPKARVILNANDLPEDWAKSAANSIYLPAEYVGGGSVKDIFFSRGPILGPGLWLFFHANPFGMKMAKHFQTSYMSMYRKDVKELAKGYTEWIDEIKKAIPTDRLLTWQVDHGWEPLTKFLGIEKPPSPSTLSSLMPSVNEQTSMTFAMYVMALIGWLTVLLPGALVGFAVQRFMR